MSAPTVFSAIHAENFFFDKLAPLRKAEGFLRGVAMRAFP